MRRPTANPLRKNRSYLIWRQMIRRCHNPKAPNYYLYGKRGIQVCDRWRESLDNFIADMGEAPENHSLDRINFNKGYFKENCRWATTTQQARNKSTNVNLTYQGETLCIKAWSERLQLAETTIGSRLRNGWSVEKALGTPPRRLSGKRTNHRQNY